MKKTRNVKIMDPKRGENFAATSSEDTARGGAARFARAAWPPVGALAVRPETPDLD